MNLAAALASVLLHLLVILPFLIQGDEQQEDKKKATAAAYALQVPELIDKGTDGDSTLHINCPDTYEGIGIRHGFDGRVIQVAKGWPADLAGLQVGDLLIDPFTTMHPFQGYMTFEAVRGGTRMKYRLRTTKICFRDAPL